MASDEKEFSLEALAATAERARQEIATWPLRKQQAATASFVTQPDLSKLRESRTIPEDLASQAFEEARRAAIAAVDSIDFSSLVVGRGDEIVLSHIRYIVKSDTDALIDQHPDPSPPGFWPKIKWMAEMTRCRVNMDELIVIGDACEAAGLHDTAEQIRMSLS